MGAGFRIENRAADKSAEIYIYEDVGAGWFGGVSAKDFAGELKRLGDVETINLRLNSGGGDVFDGLAIYRLLVDHKARVVAHVDGLAASIASVIAMAGDEIRISDSGFLMIHNAWGLALGEANDLRRTADLLDQTTAAIADVYVARTGVAAAEVRAMMDAETWLTGEDSIEKGFADTLVTNMRMAASVTTKVDLSRFAKMPERVKAALAPANDSRPSRDSWKQRVDQQAAQLAMQKRKAG